MEQRYLGRSGLRVSRFGLGTLTWGRDTDEHEAREQLTTFLDAGGTLVDTACSYGGGSAQQVLGELIGSGVAREELVLVSKAGSAVSDRQRGIDCSRRQLLNQLDQTLTDLGTDHLDLWLVQAWDRNVPLEETLSALASAVDSGRARYVGVSNYSGWQLAYASGLAGQQPLLIADQVEFSLLNRRIEPELMPCARALGVGLMAWAPLGRGVLTGKYRSGTPADSRAASAHLEAYVTPYLDAACSRVVEAVCTAADGLDRAPLDIALSWVADHPAVTCAVLGARTAAQLSGAFGGADLVLPGPIRQALDDASSGRLVSNS